MNIRKVSQKTGLSAHTLRYYEKIGLLVNVKRDHKGHRFYSDKDLVWIEFIKRLKATSMPLAEIKCFAKLRVKGDKTIPQRVELLKNHESRIAKQLDELESHRTRVHEKIKLCIQGDSTD